MNLVDIECPHCGAVGHVEDAPKSPCLMGRCPVCGGHVLYFCGTVLPLDEDVIESHSLASIRDHIMNQIDEFLEDRVTMFLEAYAGEFGIDLRAEGSGSAAATSGGAVASRLEAEVDDEDGDEEYEIEVTLEEDEDGVEPSVRHPERGAITNDEVRDFVEIDLQLIDRAWYFEKYFQR